MSPVEVFILDLPAELRPVFRQLRNIILSASPQIEEKLVYNIPFFYGKKRIFYLNPLKNGVDLGFCDGYLISENLVLETKNRTHVRTIFYSNTAEIDEEILRPLIYEAIIIDQIKTKKLILLSRS